MKEAVKVFVNDYTELQKLSWEFTKNHWKGMIVLCVVVAGAEIAVFEITSNQDKIKEKLNKVFKRKSREEKVEA